MTDTIKKSPTGSSDWSNAASGNSYTLTEADDGLYFRATSRATDEADQSMNSNSAVVGPVTTPITYDELVVGDITATGEPYVGYTLTCSEPTVTGGSGTNTLSYFWVDANSKKKEAAYQGNTAVVGDYDLGKVMYCIVSVHDTVTEETVQVESNHLGPINRPTLGDFDAWVDSELHDDPDKQIGVLPNGSVVCEVRMEAISNPPLDVTYQWTIRNGTGRLSGDETDTGIIYIAPDAAPAGAQVQCKVESRDANDNAIAAEITILVSEEEVKA